MPPTLALSQVIAEASRLCEQHNFSQASALCRQAIRSGAGRDARLLSVHARALTGLLKFHEAREAVQKALKIAPGSLELRRQLVLMLLYEDRNDDAHREAAALRRDHPGDTATIRLLAEALSRLDRKDEALALLDSAVREAPEDMHLSVALMRLAAAVKQPARGVEAADRLLAMPALPAEVRVATLFERANLLEKLGDYDGAWDSAAQANASTWKDFDRAAHRAGVDRLIEVWTRDAAAALPRVKRRTDPYIFILGMPRSGTSLVEQILASHPRVFGGGELRHVSDIAAILQSKVGQGFAYVTDLRPLTPENLDKAAAHYIEQTRALAPGAERFTDKMPSNYLHLGLISVLFPQAKVVHCSRDARDNCVSCWFLDFDGKHNSFAYDLEDLGDYYADYWRLMAHWRRTLDIPILDLRYEEMTADQEGQTRRLLDFCGLEFHERCLRFHETKRDVRTLSTEQVKRPMYRSSVGRWKRYEAHLGPLLSRLPAEAFHESADRAEGSP